MENGLVRSSEMVSHPWDRLSGGRYTGYFYLQGVWGCRERVARLNPGSRGRGFGRGCCWVRGPTVFALV